MTVTRKNIAKMISAGVVFCVIFAVLTMVFEPKWTSYHSDQMQTRLESFYKEEKNTMDVIYLGSSYSYCGISPLRIWEEQGITGYVFSGTSQKTWMSVYYLEEALKYQTPEVVVYEAGPIFEENDATEEHNRKNIDYLRWSSTKLRAIMDICSDTGESRKEYLFPLFRYHARWQGLEQKDFHLTGDPSYFLMGTMSWCATRPAKEKDQKLYAEWEPRTMKQFPDSVGGRCESAVLKMKEMCEEKGIQFQMVRLPSIEWSPDAAETVRQFAEQNDIPYLDMNVHQKEVGIDWETDTPDNGEHLNIFGCTKASRYLGRYLKENYTFKTELSEKCEEHWKACAEKFDALEESYRLSGIAGLSAYAKALDNKDYITMFAAAEDAQTQLTETQRAALADPGLAPQSGGEEPEAGADEGPGRGKEPEAGADEMPRAAVLDGAQVVLEMPEQKSGKTEKERNSYTWKQNHFSFEEKTTKSGEKKLRMLVNGEKYAVNRTGVSLVVYSKALGQVVDVVNFDTSGTSASARHKKQTLLSP